MKNINKAIAFAKKETVLIVAMLLAVISAFFVTPDKAYASYIDFRTLGLLFSLMTVTEGCKGLGIFEKSGRNVCIGKGTGGICRGFRKRCLESRECSA